MDEMLIFWIFFCTSSTYFDIVIYLEISFDVCKLFSQNIHCFLMQYTLPISSALTTRKVQTHKIKKIPFIYPNFNVAIGTRAKIGAIFTLNLPDPTVHGNRYENSTPGHLSFFDNS